MEFLQMIWSSLTTENEVLTNILVTILTFIELTVTMLLFSSILNINCNKKQKFIYVLTTGILCILINTFVPDNYAPPLTIILIFLCIKFLFKQSFLTTIIAQFLPLFIISIIESVFSKIYVLILGKSFDNCFTIPIQRIFFMLIIYLCIFIIFLISKRFKINITLLETLSKKNKYILIINFILACIAIISQLYLISFYSATLSNFVTLISIITLISYFVISIYSLIKATNLEVTTQNLEIEKTYNKTLTLLHDNIRGFKHDFNNIVQAIGGYVVTNDMPGLKKYYSQLLEDCQKCNNLTALSPDAINNPPIYAILADKYHIADEKGIKVNLEIFLDLNTLNIKIYEFTRILGILLDNAIEAASLCEEKIINIRMQKTKNVQLLIIENTYINKDVDVDKIFEKDFSTKKVKSGLGLWEVRQYLKKSKNLNLYTSKNDKYFKQQFEIYPQ